VLVPCRATRLANYSCGGSNLGHEVYILLYHFTPKAKSLVTK